MANTLYVGIGSSAGGLHALQKLLAKLPKNMGYIYIIAQHLDPKEKSSLAEILSRSCSMPVHEIDEKTKFYSNRVYVIPSGHNLVHGKKGLMLQTASSMQRGPSPSVDALFEALALYKQKNTVGLILTGSGHDGTTGAQKIKEYGGITIAQDPTEAQYSSMPTILPAAASLNLALICSGVTSSLTSPPSRWSWARACSRWATRP